ncbi:endonuclease/exonuclease/phosphatase family protein [uncultured Dokdonia sp.]|uniref:endonuclease/exonuclease/phosphatase family protein n=1 Tax=uncultured Dokdonia sp. TaxID=575653 RepID=UPI00262BB091|nr:endonuclease/exonuclease/phosphatase family protein [uncultured Dokdonia sp.]
MAFRKKAQTILFENPDILVIQECECLDKLIFKDEIQKPNDSFWFGDNPHKGLGVFTYGEYAISPLPDHNTDFRFVVPLQISNGQITYTLLAIWAQKPETNDNYGIHIWNAINYYTEIVSLDNLLLIGDFNSNTFWDKPNRESNHSNVVAYLSKHTIESTYHYFHNQIQGKEKDPTFYLYKQLGRPYHLDYCFVSKTSLRNYKTYI